MRVPMAVELRALVPAGATLAALAHKAAATVALGASAALDRLFLGVHGVAARGAVQAVLAAATARDHQRLVALVQLHSRGATAAAALRRGQLAYLDAENGLGLERDNARQRHAAAAPVAASTCDDEHVLAGLGDRVRLGLTLRLGASGLEEAAVVLADVVQGDHRGGGHRGRRRGERRAGLLGHQVARAREGRCHERCSKEHRCRDRQLQVAPAMPGHVNAHLTGKEAVGDLHIVLEIAQRLSRRRHGTCSARAPLLERTGSPDAVLS
mmetsp:Transcript_84489/g.217601  ORF Transcript_84489/g.217601 Transcript_84489/m.217601 type:complete len:268 (+) Transcript_84489:1380-2183(+)